MPVRKGLQQQYKISCGCARIVEMRAHPRPEYMIAQRQRNATLLAYTQWVAPV